ncbi:hypothetical protein CMV_028090 [Castanea mollissima]|uniref:methylmalonate-semialdehyde dehydrogenase (CoA acylating) n=1 Tax=Castanea mollissima TaxID=60419 RepID=A0A8J4Q9D0_9ROSI|nr:hypothetical protein CMV_028090 [Castanea mollissima]
MSNMGAKNNAIVMPDANEDATLNALVASGFGAAGQRCMALSTVVRLGGLKSCENKVVERAKALKVNAGTEPNADLGPVISKQATERIHTLIQSGVESGARLVLDGRDIVGMSEDVSISINKFFDEAMMVELAVQSADLHHAMAIPAGSSPSSESIHPSHSKPEVANATMQTKEALDSALQTIETPDVASLTNHPGNQLPKDIARFLLRMDGQRKCKTRWDVRLEDM